MNCEEAKKHLIESVYGELDTLHRAGLEEHVASCASCRQKLDDLQQSRSMLDLLGEKPVRIEATAVLERASRRAARSGRHWRRVAVAAGAAAACLLAVMLSGLRVEWHATHVVVAWGHGGEEMAVGQRSHSKAHSSRSTGVSQPDAWKALRHQEDRIAALDELMRLVVAELDSAERRHRRTLGNVRTQFAELRRQNALRWKLLDNDVRDLGATYLAAYRPGSQPQSGSDQSDKNEQGDRP